MARYAIVLVPAVSLMLVGCQRPLCCGKGAGVTDAGTGEPVIDAGVEWVATNSSKLGNSSYDDYLDDHGRPIGRTDEYGGILIPVCGQSEALDFVNSRFTTSNDITLLRITDGDHSEVVVVRTERESVGQGLPEILSIESTIFGVTVSGVLCQSDSSVDELIPPYRRSGNSTVTIDIWQRPLDAPPPYDGELFFPNEPPGHAVSDAPVEFATATREELDVRSADQILDESGDRVGKTNSRGTIDLQVFTDVPPYDLCHYGIVAEVWIVRVEIDGQPHTVVMKPLMICPPLDSRSFSAFTNPKTDWSRFM